MENYIQFTILLALVYKIRPKIIFLKIISLESSGTLPDQTLFHITIVTVILALIKYQIMIILVTGCIGMIGYNVCMKLLNDTAVKTVIGVDIGKGLRESEFLLRDIRISNTTN